MSTFSLIIHTLLVGYVFSQQEFTTTAIPDSDEFSTTLTEECLIENCSPVDQYCCDGEDYVCVTCRPDFCPPINCVDGDDNEPDDIEDCRLGSCDDEFSTTETPDSGEFTTTSDEFIATDEFTTTTTTDVFTTTNAGFTTTTGGFVTTDGSICCDCQVEDRSRLGCPDDPACEALVCADDGGDPRCCSQGWRQSQCADVAAGRCSVTPSPLDECCGCLTENSDGGCDSDSPCESKVCEADPYCCDSEWDGICVVQAQGVCDTGELPICCGCTVQNPDGACPQDPECEAEVCEVDTFCCNEGVGDRGFWDRTCTIRAGNICGDPNAPTLPPDPLPECGTSEGSISIEEACGLCNNADDCESSGGGEQGLCEWILGFDNECIPTPFIPTTTDEGLDCGTPPAGTISIADACALCQNANDCLSDGGGEEGKCTWDVEIDIECVPAGLPCGTKPGSISLEAACSLCDNNANGCSNNGGGEQGACDWIDDDNECVPAPFNPTTTVQANGLRE